MGVFRGDCRQPLVPSAYVDLRASTAESVANDVAPLCGLGRQGWKTAIGTGGDAVSFQVESGLAADRWRDWLIRTAPDRA